MSTKKWYNLRSKSKIDKSILNKYPEERRTRIVRSTENLVEINREPRSCSSETKPKVPPRNFFNKYESTPELDIIERSKGSNTEDSENTLLSIETSDINFSKSGEITQKFMDLQEEETIDLAGSKITSSTLIEISDEDREIRQKCERDTIHSIRDNISKGTRFVPQARRALQSYRLLDVKRSLKQKSVKNTASVEKLKSPVKTFKPKKLFEMKSDNDEKEWEDLEEQKPSTSGRKSTPSINSFGLANVRDAIKLIPDFDGKRESLKRYISGLNSAFDIVGPALEEHLLKLARLKLSPAVWNKVSQDQFDNVKEYIEHLQRIYDPPRNIYQLTADLGGALQLPTETVDEFATRIQDLAVGIIEAHYQKEGYVHKTERMRVENMALACFIKGINLRYRLDVKGCETLKDAVNKARVAERELNEYEELHERVMSKQKSDKKTKITVIEQTNVENKTENVPNQSICQLCKKIGHTADRCKFNPKNVTASPGVICQVCNKAGHTADKCYSLKPNQTAKPVITCEHCGKTGHTIDKCYSLAASKNPSGLTICQICNKRGHTADKCYQNQRALQQQQQFGQNSQNLQNNNNNNNNQNRLSTLQCFNCQEYGHMSRECPNKQRMNGQNTRNSGNFQNQDNNRGYPQHAFQGVQPGNSIEQIVSGNGMGLPESGVQKGANSKTHPGLLINIEH